MEDKNYLKTNYDSKKSFGGKAYTKEERRRLNLYSYSTLVAYIEDGQAHINGTYSVTTVRHIKEFLKQNGIKAESTKQIVKDYGKK